MRKFSFLYAILTILFVNCAFAQEDLTLVVGSVRAAGGVGDPVKTFVGQARADFTHTKSFLGRVVSMDRCPERSGQSLAHRCIDFALSSPGDILRALDGVRPTRVFFEWFPSCVMQEPKDNVVPLLIRAVEKAFAILAPGGEVLIDHMPYVVTLPADVKEAPRAFIGAKGALGYYHDVISAKPESERATPGSISRLLQQADPFTLHLSKSERDEVKV